MAFSMRGDLHVVVPWLNNTCMQEATKVELTTVKAWRFLLQILNIDQRYHSHIPRGSGDILYNHIACRYHGTYEMEGGGGKK